MPILDDDQTRGLGVVEQAPGLDTRNATHLSDRRQRKRQGLAGQFPVVGLAGDQGRHGAPAAQPVLEDAHERHVVAPVLTKDGGGDDAALGAGKAHAQSWLVHARQHRLRPLVDDRARLQPRAHMPAPGVDEARRRPIDGGLIAGARRDLVDETDVFQIAQKCAHAAGAHQPRPGAHGLETRQGDALFVVRQQKRQQGHDIMAGVAEQAGHDGVFGDGGDLAAIQRPDGAREPRPGHQPAHGLHRQFRR